jgi:hypothetical protein
MSGNDSMASKYFEPEKPPSVSIGAFSNIRKHSSEFYNFLLPTKIEKLVIFV